MTTRTNSEGEALRPLRDDVVVVVGRNFGNMLAIIRSLGVAGYGVEVLRLHRAKPSVAHPMSGMKSEAESKYVTAYREQVAGASSRKAVEALRQFACPGFRKLVLPADDYSLDLLDGALDALADDFLLPSIKVKPGELLRCMDKGFQKQLAKACGLPVLPGATVTVSADGFQLPDDVPFPCFVKPESSLPGAKTKMRRCDDLQDLTALLSGFTVQGEHSVLLESFASIAREYSILGVATSRGVVSPCAFKHVAGGHRERKGVAISGVLVPVEELGGVAQVCNRLISELGYVGIFDIDFIQTEDGGIYFEEANFRPGSSAHAFTLAGCNLVKLFCDDVLKGVPVVQADCACQAGALFVNEKVLLEEFARGDVSEKDMRRMMGQADIRFVDDGEDPDPYGDFKRYFKVAKALRFADKLRGR